MTTLPHHVSASLPALRQEETQAADTFVLATRVVHRAETLLAAAEQFPLALIHIEAAFEIALSVTAASTWSEIRDARDHLDAAQAELDNGAYWLY